MRGTIVCAHPRATFRSPALSGIGREVATGIRPVKSGRPSTGANTSG